MALLEVLEARQQPSGAKGRYHRQLDHAGALLPHHRQGIAFNGVQLGRHAPAVRQAGFCELYTTARAAEQLDIEELFQAGHLSADCTLGQGQFLGGLGKALVAGGRFKADQGSSTGDFTAHIRQPH
ncbi:hypothetical protein D3C76_1410990 [compost metagenome]